MVLGCSCSWFCGLWVVDYRSLAAYFDGHGSGLSSWVWFNFVVCGWLSSWVFVVVQWVWLGFGGFVI